MPDPNRGALFGIGRAATEAGVSERALRYYQQLGLITPTGRTPGGMRRYSEGDVARVVHLRELQQLLGFNLEEIKVVFAREDRLAELRVEYHAPPTGARRRRQIIREALDLRADLRATVAAKIEGLERFAADLDAEAARLTAVLADRVPEPVA